MSKVKIFLVKGTVFISSLFTPAFLLVVRASAQFGPPEGPDQLLKDTAPMRLSAFEDMLANVLIIIWALSIPYFLFTIISIGAKWMISGGDEQKLGVLKTRGGNILLSVGLVFGGYLVIKIIMRLLLFQDPNSCFKSLLPSQTPFFQFFFSEACD